MNTPAPGLEEHRKKLFTCRVELSDWQLHIAHLARREDRDLGNVMDLALQGARAHVRRCFPSGRLEESETVAAIRDCLRRQGIDPSTTPPSAESVLQELLAADASGPDDLANQFATILIAKSHAPWSVLERGQLQPPLVFRRGTAGESLPRSTGVLDCAGLPVLADQGGVIASPWTRESPRATGDGRGPVFICYLPQELFRTVGPRAHIGRAAWLTWAYQFIFERTCRHRPAAL